MTLFVIAFIADFLVGFLAGAAFAWVHDYRQSPSREGDGG